MQTLRREVEVAADSDVTLMVEGQAIHAHRFVLVARSQLWRGMLSEEWNSVDENGMLTVHDASYDGSLRVRVGLRLTTYFCSVFGAKVLVAH